ncbi:MAG TPA: outer membrane lipoprotein chaperone LolA [Gammaproteobacteria bacterium]|nr:outer membrane lipoprotein chaperone LolA [Gammaproteobacteria bacterium]
MEVYNRTDSGRSSHRRLRTIERALCLAVILLSAAAAYAQPGQGGESSGPAKASASGPGADDLRAFLAQVETLTADFKQQVHAPDGHVLKTASGSMALSRPDRFRWVYDKPYRQLVIADGRYLWVYDIELEQATRAPLDETSPSSPAMLLSGDQAVREGFDVVESFERDGLDWVRLEPKLASADFRSVLIGFQGSSPRRLKLEDSLNQLTDIELDRVVVNPKLKDKLFEFKPPRGVDVIGAGD